MNLLPKVKIEIVVSLVPVQKVIETAKAVLHTGQIGDGKVFVYDIENVVKIRTGEEGYLALQIQSKLFINNQVILIRDISVLIAGVSYFNLSF